MAVTLTGTGGLFTRLGKIGKALNAINSGGAHSPHWLASHYQ